MYLVIVVFVVASPEKTDEGKGKDNSEDVQRDVRDRERSTQGQAGELDLAVLQQQLQEQAALLQETQRRNELLEQQLRMYIFPFLLNV